jgi:hypothetical protein
MKMLTLFCCVRPEELDVKVEGNNITNLLTLFCCVRPEELDVKVEGNIIIITVNPILLC